MNADVSAVRGASDTKPPRGAMLVEVEEQHRAALDAMPNLDASRFDVVPLDNPHFKVMVADATSKSLICDRRTQAPWAVLIMASTMAPDAVAKAVERTLAMADALGPELGSVVLRPTWIGEHNGSTCALWPYRRTIAQSRGRGRIERMMMVWRVERWLQDVALVGQRTIASEQIDTSYLEPLDYIARSPLFSQELQEHGARAHGRFREGALRPIAVPAHNDLWLGNVLHAGNRHGRYRFRLIDCGGARPSGYPFVDLVRFLGGSRINPLFLKRSVRRMARSLAVEDCAAYCYLLAAFGRLGLERGDFPIERYQALVTTQYQALTSSLRG